MEMRHTSSQTRDQLIYGHQPARTKAAEAAGSCPASPATQLPEPVRHNYSRVVKSDPSNHKSGLDSCARVGAWRRANKASSG